MSVSRRRNLGPGARGGGGAAGRRGYALAMVLMVALMASLAIVVIMDRQGAASLAVQRQVEEYTNHHEYAGVQELIDRWTQTARPDLRSVLGEGGEAFVLEMPRGEEMRVFLFDAQGAALLNTGHLLGRQRLIAQRVAELLKELDDAGYVATEEEGGVDPRTGTGVGGGTGELVRPFGPPTISANSAPEPVLRALTMAVVDPERAETVATAIASSRSNEPMTLEAITRVVRESGATPQEVQDVQSMLVDSATLWRAEVVMTTSSGRVISRSGGLVLLSGAASTGVDRGTQFLTWERMRPEE